MGWLTKRTLNGAFPSRKQNYFSRHKISVENNFYSIGLYSKSQRGPIYIAWNWDCPLRLPTFVSDSCGTFGSTSDLNSEATPLVSES